MLNQTLSSESELQRRKCEAISVVRKMYPDERQLEWYYGLCLHHRGAAAVATLRADVGKEWRLRQNETEAQFLVRVFYPNSAMIRLHLAWCEESHGAAASARLREELLKVWVAEDRRLEGEKAKLAA